MSTINIKESEGAPPASLSTEMNTGQIKARIKKKILPSSIFKRSSSPSKSKSDTASSPIDKHDDSKGKVLADDHHKNAHLGRRKDDNNAINNIKPSNGLSTSAQSPTKLPQYGRRAGKQQGNVNLSNASPTASSVATTTTTTTTTTTATTALRKNVDPLNTQKDIDLHKLRTLDSEDVNSHSSPTSANRSNAANNAKRSVQLKQSQRSTQGLNGNDNTKITQHVAPTNYRTVLPKLAELQSNMPHWDKMLQNIQGDCDLSSLTAGLVRQLDEDATWNPDMLLVQLTSDMYDAADLKQELAINAGKQFSGRIGKLRGGEVISNAGRRRRCKSANNDNNLANNEDDEDDIDDLDDRNYGNEIFTLSNNLLLPQQASGKAGAESELKTPVLSSVKMTPKVLQVQSLQRERDDQSNKSTQQLHNRPLDPISAKKQRKRNLASAGKSRRSSVHSNRSNTSNSNTKTPKKKT